MTLELNLNADRNDDERNASIIAVGLVLRTGKEANPFWTGISREFLTGAILDVYSSRPQMAER